MRVSNWSKVLEDVLKGERDQSIAFDDLCGLLVRLGFEMRCRGSHHVFRRKDIVERPNLQRDGKHAKPYQVRQIRAMILQNKLAGDL